MNRAAQSVEGAQLDISQREVRRRVEEPTDQSGNCCKCQQQFLYTFFSALSFFLAMRSVFTLRYLLYYFRIRMRICGGRRERERAGREGG